MFRLNFCAALLNKLLFLCEMALGFAGWQSRSSSKAFESAFEECVKDHSAEVHEFDQIIQVGDKERTSRTCKVLSHSRTSNSFFHSLILFRNSLFAKKQVSLCLMFPLPLSLWLFFANDDSNRCKHQQKTPG